MPSAKAAARGAQRAGAIVAALSATVVLAGGCYTHNCDPSDVTLGNGAAQSEGGDGQFQPVTTRLPDGEIEWSSSPVAGPWLDFPGQRTYTLFFSQPFASAPDVDCQVAADAGNPQNNFVPCGSIAQFSQLTMTSVVVFNPTCAGYGLRVLARGLPASFDGGSTPAPDASAD